MKGERGEETETPPEEEFRGVRAPYVSERVREEYSALLDEVPDELVVEKARELVEEGKVPREKLFHNLKLKCYWGGETFQRSMNELSRLKFCPECVSKAANMTGALKKVFKEVGKDELTLEEIRQGLRDYRPTQRFGLTKTAHYLERTGVAEKIIPGIYKIFK